MIFYGKQTINNDDIKSVIKSLKSDFLTQGSLVRKFEKKLNNFFGSKNSAVLSNGTAALHLVGKALKWNKGDLILTTPISFAATSNCIEYANATPVFVDIDKNTANIDPNQLETKIRKLNKYKNKIKAIIAIDYAGHPCDWKALNFIAKKNDLILINDNCHATGAKYNGSQKYAVNYADIVTQSFHPVKNFTTGEGGAVLSNTETIIRKIKCLRNHGIEKKNNKTPWYYQINQLGYNYRLTDIQCALGISQLKKLNNFIKLRNKIANRYDLYFKNIDNISITKNHKNILHAYHLYPLKINFKKIKKSKNDLFNYLKNKNFSIQTHYIPIHLLPYYKKKYSYKVGDFPIAENFYRSEVSLPIFPKLKKIDQIKFIYTLKKFLNV